MQSIAEKIIDFEIPGLAVGTMSKGTLISPQVGLPLVVMVHGTGNDKDYPWANVVECFVGSGFQVVVFDLPGHGKESSDVLAGSSSASLEKLLDVLKGLTVWTKLYGLGQSLGGALLLEAASRKDLGFRKLSIWGLPSDREPDFRVLTELLSPFFISTWSLPTYYGLWGSLPALFQFKRRDFPIRTSHESYIEHVLDIIKNSREKILARSCIPTQFIHGKFDFIGDLDFAETLSRQIDSSHLHRILETHFSLLCSEKAADLAIDWFLQH